MSNCFLPQRPSARPNPARRPEARGWGRGEPVKHQGLGLFSIQTRWTQGDGDKNSKQLPNGWLGIWAAGRAGVLPTPLGDVLASKSRSDPENPSNHLVPPPGQVMGSILVPWGTGGALGDLGMGGVSPPAASQLNSLRPGAAQGRGAKPFSRLQLPFQAIELEALLSASRPKREQEGGKQTSAGTAEPLASHDGRSPLTSLPASAHALQSVVPEPPRGSSETENPTRSLSHLLKSSQDLPLHSQHPQSFQSPRRPTGSGSGLLPPRHPLLLSPWITLQQLPGLLSVLPLLPAQDLCTHWSPTQDAGAPDTCMAASSSSQVTCSLPSETLPYHSVKCALPFTLHTTF